METRKIYEKVENGKITLGKKILVGRKGEMTYLGRRNNLDESIGKIGSNPVFVSEIKNHYHAIQVFRCGQTYTDLIKPSDGVYTNIQKRLLEVSK